MYLHLQALHAIVLQCVSLTTVWLPQIVDCYPLSIHDIIDESFGTFLAAQAIPSFLFLLDILLYSDRCPDLRRHATSGFHQKHRAPPCLCANFQEQEPTVKRLFLCLFAQSRNQGIAEPLILSCIVPACIGALFRKCDRRGVCHLCC